MVSILLHFKVSELSVLLFIKLDLENILFFDLKNLGINFYWNSISDLGLKKKKLTLHALLIS